ncbi:MAG: 50S ribosomal protein L15e [Nanoarchaeota archaeon]|nr:50S ribosomal protein L15e [Nanoarchaeota archaeon]
MSMYKYVRELWKKPKENLQDIWKQRVIDWKKEPTTLRIPRPTRIDRARSLGYKAKQGYIVVRQRLMRQKRMRPKFASGRRSRAMRRKKVVNMSYQWIAEQRAAKDFKNCEVLNSYYVAETGQYMWYEIILVDKTHPVIQKDKKINWIVDVRGRAARGLTSAARKSQNKNKNKSKSNNKS